jgi:hypothetical protein
MLLYLSIALILAGFYFTGKKEGWWLRQLSTTDTEDYKICQEKWHTFGFWQRIALGLALVVLVIPNWYEFVFWSFIMLWFAWVGYDGWSNLTRNLNPYIKQDRFKWFRNFFYSGSQKTGTYSKIDLAIGKYLPTIKFIYTIVTIATTIIYLLVWGF